VVVGQAIGFCRLSSAVAEMSIKSGSSISRSARRACAIGLVLDDEHIGAHRRFREALPFTDGANVYVGRTTFMGCAAGSSGIGRSTGFSDSPTCIYAWLRSSI
jgi:hypothetical protein